MRALSWFVVACLLSWPAVLLPSLFGHSVEGPWLLAVAMPYILAPAVANVVWRRFVTREPAVDVGEAMRFNATLWIAWVLPLVLLWGAALLAHVAGWAALDLSGNAIADRVAAVGRAEEAEEIRAQLTQAAVPYAVLASLQGLIVGLLFAPIWYAEELGWRGVFLEELRGRLGFWNAALLSGLGWGLWRLPLLLAGGFLPGEEASVRVALLLVTASVPLGALLAWLRVRSGTVWAPAVTLSVLTMVGRFDELVLAGGTPVQTSPLGVAGGLVALMVAVALFVRWPKGPTPEVVVPTPAPGA